MPFRSIHGTWKSVDGQNTTKLCWKALCSTEELEVQRIYRIHNMMAFIHTKTDRKTLVSYQRCPIHPHPPHLMAINSRSLKIAWLVSTLTALQVKNDEEKLEKLRERTRISSIVSRRRWSWGHMARQTKKYGKYLYKKIFFTFIID